MLSYRHAFHAGNHADILKHFIELQVLRHLLKKDKPFWYIDTHAGAGHYALDQGYATQLAEYESGIGILWDRDDLPAALDDYVAVIETFNPDGHLRAYPGSPAIAQRVMRDQDRLRLFELHSTDSELLQRNFRPAGRQVMVQQMDGFTGLKSVLPPPPRRGFILIDPPFEDKQDYRRVVQAIQEGVQRFATGTYAVWYPLLSRPETAHQQTQMVQQLTQLPDSSWLNVTLRVRQPDREGFGMYGSGMFVLNPPWTLQTTLQDIMPYLVTTLGQDGGAGFDLGTSPA